MQSFEFGCDSLVSEVKSAHVGAGPWVIGTLTILASLALVQCCLQEPLWSLELLLASSDGEGFRFIDSRFLFLFFKDVLSFLI